MLMYRFSHFKNYFLSLFCNSWFKGPKEIGSYGGLSCIVFRPTFQLYQCSAPPLNCENISLPVNWHQCWLLTLGNKILCLFNKLKSIYLSLSNKQFLEFVTRYRSVQMRATLWEQYEESQVNINKACISKNHLHLFNKCSYLTNKGWAPRKTFLVTL